MGQVDLGALVRAGEPKAVSIGESEKLMRVVKAIAWLVGLLTHVEGYLGIHRLLSPQTFPH
jgi:hypothetical protein